MVRVNEYIPYGLIDYMKMSVKRNHFYDNGNKWLECYYINGKAHGKSISWYHNGNKRWEKGYINGERHGEFLEWREDGTKWTLIDYINDKIHGKAIEWCLNGTTKRYEYDYVNGKKV